MTLSASRLALRSAVPLTLAAALAVIGCGGSGVVPVGVE